MTDWVASERIDYGDISGFNLFAQAQGDYFYFSLTTSISIDPNTTFWFNTDQNSATGYQIFGFAGGAEFNLNIKSDGTAALYTGGAGQTLVLDNVQLAYSANHQAIEFAIPKTALGSPTAINILYDVNDIQYAPANYSAQPYIAYNNTATRIDPTQRIGIVYSQTTADHYFSPTAYSQLFMAVESQAMQAGISFDLLTESDLTDLAKLANYDALVFPSFANVQASQLDAITNTLLQATRQFGIGLITAGNFMSNDETGAPLPGDSYARMKLLFDATRVTGGFPADVTVNSSDATQSVFTTLAPGAPIHNYSQVGWDAFQSVSGTGQTIATETVGGATYSAALATQTGGKNVLFSTPGVMADNNLLWQAIDYVAKDPGIQVSLDLTRFKSIVASRTDMDQAMQVDDVSPGDNIPGIYDKLLPILGQWKQQFNFVGSYYVDIGDNPTNGEVTDWAVSAPYYAQILAMGNELGTHSMSHPEDTNSLTSAQIQYQFAQSRLVLEQQMSAYLGTPFTDVGAAVPGAPETLQTAKDIIQYFNYMTGGYSSVGSGYPGAFGFLTPDLNNAVYLAPNTSFDFTLVDYQKLGAAGAATAWANEWNRLVANANTPIVLWPWHDYGPTQWSTSPPTASPYTLQMFTDWIDRAYQSGSEFVTEADLAARIQSFYHSGVTSTVDGNVISVTVNSAHAGDFALNLSGQGSQVIENVAGWYAYDYDSLFLPDAGGNFTITMGAAADDVTHITSLPMRGDLLSVTGDGLNLGFSMNGEGDVLIDLGQFGSMVPFVTGATIVSLVGDQLELALAGPGVHNVVLNLVVPIPAEVVSAVAFSADTGASATDLITQTAAQTITGTLSAALAAGDVVKLSLDNGATWLGATAAVGATTFSLSGVTLVGSGTLIARVESAGGVASAAFTHTYTLDQVPPAETAAILAMTSDSGVAGDFITNNGAAGRTVSGTLSTALSADETLQVSSDAGATWTTAVVTGTTWNATDSAVHAASWTIETQVVDLAGNIGAVSSRAVTFDTTPPAAPTAPDLIATSDSGLSNTDNLTNVTAPSFAGSGAEAGSTVTLSDGAIAIGTGIAAGDGSWSITATTLLADGVHSISARSTDLAGNASANSAALSVTIDTTAPIAPSAPDLIAASDSGKSTTDNVTTVTTPTFKGTAAGLSTVTLYDGTTAIGSIGATAAGAWTITASTLLDGVHSITAKAMDAAGNVGIASTALAMTVDTVAAAPSTPDMTAGTDKGVFNTDNITSDNTPAFTGTAEAGSTITLLDGATVIGTGNATGAGVWTITISPLTDGTHGISAIAKDVAGNVSAASSALPVTIDSVAPTAPTTPDLIAASDSGVSNVDNITNVTTPTFTGSAEAGATVTLFNGTTKAGTGLAAADGSWTITSSALGTGSHSISTKATDVAGNVSAASLALTVVIDTATTTPTRPDLLAASDSGVSNTDNLTNVTTPTFAGSAEAGSTVTLFDGALAIGTGTATAAGTWSIVASPLADGVHSITDKADDVAGNVSASSTALGVTIDTQAPVAPTLTGGSTTTLIGKGEAGATVSLSDGTYTIGTATVGSGGNWSMSFVASATQRGLVAAQIDKAGNTGAISSGQALIGTGAADTLAGGPGNDLLIGGAGADVFSFGATFGQDIITDFAAGGTAHDIINFQGSAVLNSFANVLSHTTAVGSGVMISLDANNTLTLANIAKSNLSSANFAFS
jgi:serralysin